MTYKVLTEYAPKVLHRSRIKLASVDPNLRLDNPTPPTEQNDTTDATPVSTGQPDTTINTLNESVSPMAIITTYDFIGRSNLSLPEEDGTRRRIKIIEQLDDVDDILANDSNMIKFRANTDDGTIKEIITYNQIIDNLEAEDRERDE